MRKPKNKQVKCKDRFRYTKNLKTKYNRKLSGTRRSPVTYNFFKSIARMRTMASNVLTDGEHTCNDLFWRDCPSSWFFFFRKSTWYRKWAFFFLFNVKVMLTLRDAIFFEFLAFLRCFTERTTWGVFARKSGNKYYNFWPWGDTWGFIVNWSL